MAAEFCLEVGCKRLILTHFSQRYRGEVGEGEEVGEGVGKLLREAQEALIGTGIRVEIADDFKTFVIPAKTLENFTVTKNYNGVFIAVYIQADKKIILMMISCVSVG